MYNTNKSNYVQHQSSWLVQQKFLWLLAHNMVQGPLPVHITNNSKLFYYYHGKI